MVDSVKDPSVVHGKSMEIPWKIHGSLNRTEPIVGLTLVGGRPNSEILSHALECSKLYFPLIHNLSVLSVYIFMILVSAHGLAATDAKT